MGIHLIWLLSLLFFWVSFSGSSTCLNLTPCNNKEGTCIPGNDHCSGKQYTSVRYCAGAGCKCCVPLYHNHGDHKYGRVCSGGSCGIRGTCRFNCRNEEELHSGSCGANCMCCARRNYHLLDERHGHYGCNTGQSCGRRGQCNRGSCPYGYRKHAGYCEGGDCHCCVRRDSHVCLNPGISCNNIRGTCHERQCPYGKVYMGSCYGDNCVCCAYNTVSALHGANCGRNGYCRQGSCFINEYQIGICAGISAYVCCVKNQISVCTNVNGPCNGHTGKCRSLCLPGETDMGLGSCYGSSCRCCKLPVCPLATCIKGPQRGTCHSNICQNTEFDIGECITGQTSCRCCAQIIVTCPVVDAKCGQNGKCRTGGCLNGEAVHSGNCGGGACICCATIPSPVVTCPRVGLVCGQNGVCRTSTCLVGEISHSGDCGGGTCACCATITISSGRVKRQAPSQELADIYKDDDAGDADFAKLDDDAAVAKAADVADVANIDESVVDVAKAADDATDVVAIVDESVAKAAVAGSDDVAKIDDAADDAATDDVKAYDVAANVANYIDVCKKNNINNVIQVVCTRKQLSSRTGKHISLVFFGNDDFHISEEYGEYMDLNFYHHIKDSIEIIHNEDFSQEGNEYYDSKEENIIKTDFLDDLKY